MKIKKQEDINECGLYVVQSLHHHYYDEWLSINQLKHTAKMSNQGINVSSLCDLGFEYGIILEAYNAPPESLESNEHFIILLKNNNGLHYVVTKYNGDDFDIWDSAQGKYKLTKQELKELYSGVVITVSKGSYEKTEEIDVTNIWTYLSSNVPMIVWTLITLLISLILTIGSSLFMKLIFDKVLPDQNTSLLTLICLAFGFLALLRVFTSFFKTYLSKKLCNTIEIDLTKRYIKKLQSISLFDFSKIDISDHMRRVSLIPHAALFVATGIQVVFDEGITLVVASAFLIYLSPVLFGVAIGFGITSSLLALLFNFFIKEKYLTLIKVNQTEFNNRNKIINSSANIKETARSSYLYKSWYKSFAVAKNLDYKVWKYSGILGSLITLLKLIAPILLTYLSVNLIFENKISIGSFLMFLSLFAFFLSPLHSLSDFIIKARQNLKYIDLIQFVMEIPDQEENVLGHKQFKIKTIELRNLSVNLDKQILNIKNILFNKSIKLTGANGTGKSILLRTIAGLYQFEGEIMYNNLESRYLATSAIQNKVLLLSDQEYIFASNVLEYITLGNKHNLKIWKNADKKYGLSNFLNQNGISLLMQLNDNAKNLSQGQRQLVQLMRIFASDFDLLIVDEATEFISDENLSLLKPKINHAAKFIIEVSHSKRYISNGKEVNIEKFNQCLY